MYPTKPKRPLQPTQRSTDVTGASRGTAHRQLRILTVLALAVPLLLAGCTSSITSTSSPSYQPLPSPMQITPEPYKPVYVYATVLKTIFTLPAPETLRVTDQLEVSLQPSTNAEVDNLISCWQGSTEIADQGTGTNYTGSTLQWGVSMLFTAPAGTSDCELQTHTDDGSNTNYHMRLLPPANGPTTDGTWLEVSSTNQVGAEQWEPLVYCGSTDADHVCSYVGGSSDQGNPAAIDVFSPPTDVWMAGDDATFIDAVGTFELTVCYPGTGSCKPSEYGPTTFYGSTADDNSAVLTYLEIDQLNPDMTVCQTHRAYTEQHPSGDTFDISNSTHHQPLYFHVIAPVSQTCSGSRTFGIDLYVQWKGGNPIKLEEGDVNVINSVRATTTPVPRVTGDTEAQADAAIQAAGLTASPVYVMSPAAPGTVVGQNAPAGTVEPTGSPVQIMVSQGQTTVPPVLSDTLSKATAAIRNAGLSVGSVTYLNNCIDPGTVQSQDPLPGAQAPLGSPVNLRLSTCTSPTQQPK